jgi:hypothetical protein
VSGLELGGESTVVVVVGAVGAVSMYLQLSLSLNQACMGGWSGIDSTPALTFDFWLWDQALRG